jgi:hypothetical protein
MIVFFVAVRMLFVFVIVVMRMRMIRTLLLQDDLRLLGERILFKPM